jgi:hypothetical protein
MAGPFDLDQFLHRMAALDRAEIIAATIAEIGKYDEMQRRAKGAMRAATREHRQRLAAFLAFMRGHATINPSGTECKPYRIVIEALRRRERSSGA